MNKEDLMKSFDMIRPDESAKKRMLDNILQMAGEKDESRSGHAGRRVHFRKAIPAFALTVVLAAGVLMYSGLWSGKGMQPGKGQGYVSNDMLREDAAAQVLNQFQIGDRHYVLLSDDLRSGFGLPAAVNEADIGEKITDITVSPDKSLLGREVFRYIPAGCDAVIAVKNDDGYQLFRFFVFESYNNNQDEDAVEYLKLYGITSAEDIGRVVFIGHSEQSKLQGITDIRGEITDRADITQFYGFYSALKNNSDKYFDRLFNFSGAASGKYDIEVDMAGPDMTRPDIAFPTETAEPVMTSPDHTGNGEIGFGSDMPMEIAPTAPAIPDPAVDMPLAADDTVIAHPVPADTPVSNRNQTAASPSRSTMMDTGSGVSGSVQGSAGSVGNALGNPITIRIYNKNGIYYDSVYYRNIGFISRYEVGEEFAAFLSARFDS